MMQDDQLTTIQQLQKEIAELKIAKQKAERATANSLKYLAIISQAITGQKVKPKQSAKNYSRLIFDYFNKIAALPCCMYWVDTNYIVRGCNDISAKFLGFSSRQEVIGKSSTTFYANQEELAVAMADNKRVIKNNQPSVFEEESTVATNNRRASLITYKSPLLDKNKKVIGFLGITVDVTKYQKEQKAQLSAAINTIKNEFLANISHDIRTPLSGIINMAEVLESKTTDNTNKSYVHSISQAAKQLLDYLNTIIEFSKLEAPNPPPITTTEFNLKSLIQEIVRLLTNKTPLKNTQIVINYSDDLPHKIIADRMRINKILRNLISNAIKFTEQGQITINAAFPEIIDQTTSCKLSIQDTGIGISAKQIPFVFEKFSRLSASYTGRYHGSGLGLATVKKFIDDLGGNIKVTSKINHGSTFTCTLPCCLPNSIDLSLPLATKNLKILLIEDDPLCQLSQKMLITTMGHHTTTAGTATQALELLHNPYDLIISDIGLPDMDGKQLAKTIKTTHNININTPIIALTAHVSDEHKQQCLEHHIDAVLYKPLDQTKLETTIATVFKYIQF